MNEGVLSLGKLKVKCAQIEKGDRLGIPNAKSYLQVYPRILDDPLIALASAPKNRKQQIGYAIECLQRSFDGNIKKLKATENKYRLRVGDFRVLFKLVKNHITVYEIADRKDAYGN